MRLSVDSQLSIKAVNLEIIMMNKQRTCSIINGCIKAVTVIVLNWFPSNTDSLIISGCIEAVVLVVSNISIVHIYGSLKRNASHVECLVITLNPSLWLMMTSSSGNIFRVTGLLCWEFTDHRWIPLTKASNVKLWFSICAWTNGCVNHRDAGDLRHQRAHYDVTVMGRPSCWLSVIRKKCLQVHPGENFYFKWFNFNSTWISYHMPNEVLSDLIHTFETSTVQWLKFGNWNAISSQTA